MKIQLQKNLYFLLILLFPISSFCQDTIKLRNQSFEDTPRRGGYYNNVINAQKNNIKGWYDCGILDFENESAPDIFGNDNDYWSVKKDPSDGMTFLGLVVRDNKSWESVSQEFSDPLDNKKCYTFSIDLCKSQSYLSGSRLAQDSKSNYSYSNPVVLSIWGGNLYCDELELLYESPPVENEEWKTFAINFQPMNDLKFITLQAHYIDADKPYNGHILVDNISEIVVTECEE